MPSKGMGPSNPSAKRKPFEKTDHPLEKPKVTMGSNVGVTSDARKLPPQPRPIKGKRLMTGHDPITEKHPILLREDSHYAFK